MPISAEVATLFVDEMANRGVPVTLNQDGDYTVAYGDTTATINLENLSRDFERDRDPDRIRTFVDSITRELDDPDWATARPRIRWSVEGRDMKLDDTVHDIVSDQVALVLVLVSPSETEIRWITPALAERWGQTKEMLFGAARENMERLLSAADVQSESIEQHKLGMLSTEYTAFKASLVFCPGLKRLAEPVLGWPLMAVMPCRDFVYLVAEKDRELVGRLGPTVVREYSESGYPLCTEVFEITDEGVRAVAEFQKRPPGPLEEPDGLKTINYRGGLVTFRIPEDWEEEYEEEGGGTFYPDYDDSGTLRLSTLGLKSQKPVTIHTIRKDAERRAAKEGGALAELPGGNWMVTYTHTAEEDGDELTIKYWEIMNPVPPNHMRIALFSYTALKDLLDDPGSEVSNDYRMLEELIPACKFARELGE
jgi:hypothetical protein